MSSKRFHVFLFLRFLAIIVETNLTSTSFNTMLFKLNKIVPMLKSIELVEGNDQRRDRLARDDKTLAESILSTQIADFKVVAEKHISVTSLHVDCDFDFFYPLKICSMHFITVVLATMMIAFSFFFVFFVLRVCLLCWNLWTVPVSFGVESQLGCHGPQCTVGETSESRWSVQNKRSKQSVK